MAATCASFVTDNSGRPTVALLRRVLAVHVLLPPNRRKELMDEERHAADWLRASSRPVRDLVERRAARELLDGLSLNLDGSVAAATVIGRKRPLFITSSHTPSIATGCPQTHFPGSRGNGRSG